MTKAKRTTLITTLALGGLALVSPAIIHAQQFSVLHSFSGADGLRPEGELTSDAAGNLYGTTYLGGTYGAGTIFKVDATGNFTLLYSFTGGADGDQPNAGVTLDAAGNIYGATEAGGRTGAGAVFKLDTTGHLTVLHSFHIYPDGATPTSGVVLDAAGNLYGTAYAGGKNFGTVYKISAAGKFKVLYSFKGGVDGANPEFALTLDSAGNLYGSTIFRGGFGGGVVFKLTAAGKFKVLHGFQGPDGDSPNGKLALDSAGNIYGATYSGGSCPSQGGCGLIYKLDPTGTPTTLYAFTGGADGANPMGVFRDSSGNIYGTTYWGGSAALGDGVVFEIDAAGTFSVLHTFSGADGQNPDSSVIFSGGTVYGTTIVGGSSGNGVVFQIQ